MSAVIPRLKSLWNRYWYSPADGRVLGLIRLLFFSSVLLYSFFFDLSTVLLWGNVSEKLWLPHGLFRFFDDPPFAFAGLAILQKLWLTALLLCSVGLFTRVSTMAAAGLSYIYYLYTLSFGEVSHDDLGIVIFTFIFAFSRAGDYYSFDQFLFKTGDKRHQECYQWPVRLMQVVFCSIFFAAGYSKLINGGAGWFTGPSLSHYLEWSHYRSSMSPETRELGLGLFIASQPLLCKFMAHWVVFEELLAPVAIWGKKRTKIFIVLNLTAMMIGFYLTCTAGFVNMLFLYYCWLPIFSISKS